MKAFGKRRALGQHFLIDQQVAQTIADAALDSAADLGSTTLLEIGPGKGAITWPLLKGLPAHTQLQNFLLVEKDRKLASAFTQDQSILEARGKRVQLLAEDFLDLQNEVWLPYAPLTVVSNLPYSSGTQILTRLASHPQAIQSLVLMFQAEVAQRLYAEKSTKSRGSLSIWIQNQWDVQKLVHVRPRSFTPPPQVDSEVVVLTRRETPRIEILESDQGFWEKFLKTCFAHRRKMLRSFLPWQNALELAGVDGTKRAEALDWDEWSRLFQAVRQSSGR